MANPLTPEDINNYLEEHSWIEAEVQDALDAETSAQAKVCRISDPYDPDLLQALKRRVMRNLNMRKQPLGTQGSDAGNDFIPGNDPEVRRLEGPHRKLVMG